MRIRVVTLAAAGLSAGLVAVVPCLAAAIPSASALPASAVASPGAPEARRAMLPVLLDATNRERIAKGLSPVVLSPEMCAAAQAHAEDMLARSYFAHESPEGEVAAQRVARITPRAIVLSIRENILKSEGEQNDPPAVRAANIIEGWMGSPGHRANLLADDVSGAGFGVASMMVKGRLIETSVQVLGRVVGSWSAAPSIDVHAPERMRARLDAPVEFFLEDTSHPDRRYKDPHDATISWRGGVPLIIVPDRGETIVQLPKVDTGSYRLLGRLTREDGYQAIREIRVISWVIGG